MRIGMSRPSWSEADNPRIFELAASYGFDGVQVKPHQYDPVGVDPGRFKEFYGARAELARGGIIVYLGSDYRSWEAKLSPYLSFIQGVAGEQICVCAGVREEHLDEQGIEGFAEVLNAMGRKAREAGAVISLHNHTNSIVESSEQIQQVFAHIDPAYCGMTFDTAHAAKGGITDLAGALREFRRFVNAVHLKDLSADGTFCPLGEGTLDLGAVLRELRAWDFQEWLIVDEESKGVSVEDAYGRSVDFLRRHGIELSGARGL